MWAEILPTALGGRQFPKRMQHPGRGCSGPMKARSGVICSSFCHCWGQEWTDRQPALDSS